MTSIRTKLKTVSLQQQLLMLLMLLSFVPSTLLTAFLYIDRQEEDVKKIDQVRLALTAAVQATIDAYAERTLATVRNNCEPDHSGSTGGGDPLTCFRFDPANGSIRRLWPHGDVPAYFSEASLAAFNWRASFVGRSEGLIANMETGITSPYYRKFTAVFTEHRRGGFTVGIFDGLPLNQALSNLLRVSEIADPDLRLTTTDGTVIFDAVHGLSGEEPPGPETFFGDQNIETAFGPVSVAIGSRQWSSDLEYQRTKILIIFCALLVLALAGICIAIMKQSVTRPISEIKNRLTSTREQINQNTGVLKIDPLRLDQESTRTAEINSLVEGVNALYRAISEREATVANLRKQLISASERAAAASTLRMIAHDIRRPFSMMLSMLNLLRQTREQDIRAAAETYTTHVQHAIESMNAMMEDILAEGIESRVKLADMSVARLIREAVAQNVHGSDINTGVRIRFGHTRLISGDYWKLGRVFDNIYRNALEAATVGTDVAISTWDEARNGRPMVVFCIENHGSHIQKRDRKKLFIPGFTKGKKKGTGLGLSVAKKITSGHGGLLWCRSLQSGVTRFYVSLPAITAEDLYVTHDMSTAVPALPPAAAAAAGTTPSVTVPERALIALIEDNVIFRCEWEEVLKQDYEVISCEQPGELEALLRTNPGLADRLSGFVCDYLFENESDVNGLELARRLRAFGIDKPFFLMTDYDINLLDYGDEVTEHITKDPAVGVGVIKTRIKQAQNQ